MHSPVPKAMKPSLLVIVFPLLSRKRSGRNSFGLSQYFSDLWMVYVLAMTLAPLGIVNPPISVSFSQTCGRFSGAAKM